MTYGNMYVKDVKSLLILAVLQNKLDSQIELPELTIIIVLNYPNDMFPSRYSQLPKREGIGIVC